MSDPLLSCILSSATRARYPFVVCGLIALLVMSFCAANERPAPVNLFPRLKAGQTFSYQISYHSDKQIKTESNVIVATPADSAKIDVNALLSLAILGDHGHVDKANITARTKYQVLNSDTRLKVPQIEAPDNQVQRQDPKGKLIEFTILADGRLNQVSGLDALFP